MTKIVISELQPILVELSDQEAQVIQGGTNSNNGGPHVTGDYILTTRDFFGGTFILRDDFTLVHYDANGNKT